MLSLFVKRSSKNAHFNHKSIFEFILFGMDGDVLQTDPLEKID